MCVALFADLNVRIVLRGPPPAPAAIHMANSRNCVSASATRPSGTPHFTNPNFQLRVEVFDTSWISVQCALNTFGLREVFAQDRARLPLGSILNGTYFMLEADPAAPDGELVRELYVIESRGLNSQGPGGPVTLGETADREHAAARVQAVHRGRAARQRQAPPAATTGAPREAPREAPQVQELSTEESQRAAAARVQAIHRGRAARQAHKQRAPSAEIAAVPPPLPARPRAKSQELGHNQLFEEDTLFTSDEKEERKRAAARVQSIHRGRASRRQQAPPLPVRGAGGELPAPSLPYTEAELAATRMQAAMRGRAVRERQERERRVTLAREQHSHGVAKCATAASCSSASMAGSPVRSGVPPGAASSTSPTGSATVGGFCSEAQYEDRMMHLKKLKREAEERRQRELARRVLEEEKFRKEMEAETERAKAREAEREQELLKMKEEARKRGQEEREKRLAEREQLAVREKELARKRRGEVPLYKRMIEKAERVAAEEERQRDALLQGNKGKYRPVDFSSREVELPMELYEHPKEGQRHFVAPRRRADITEPGSLPDIKAYYQGKARERVVKELQDQRHMVEIHRQKAQEDKKRVTQYSKLVSELAPPAPPRATSAAPKLPPVSDPARGASKRKPDSASAASAAHAPRTTRLPPANGATARSPREPKSSQVKSSQVREPLDVKMQEERLAAYNRELSQRETQLRSQLSSEPKADATAPPDDIEALIRVRGDLSACYITAIRSKVEMLEGLFEAT